MSSQPSLRVFSSVHQQSHSFEKQQQLESWHLNMAAELDEVPPSYTSISDKPPISPEALLQSQDLLLREFTLPPKTHYLVRSNAAPSPWKLLVGPAISNAISPENTEPLRKRRYRVVYPPAYEDVYLHKSTWANNTSTLPRYHVELYGKDRYEPEPIIILGPADHESTVTNEARNLAACYSDRVVSRMQDEVSKTTRFAAFCESEYFSWDWNCKTTAAKHDMRTLTIKAKAECLRSWNLLAKLDKFLEYVGEKESRGGISESLKRSLAESHIRLERLRL